MLTKEQLNQLAERAGFGGNLRNTHRVKLELFAKMIETEHCKTCEYFNSTVGADNTVLEQTK